MFAKKFRGDFDSCSFFALNLDEPSIRKPGGGDFSYSPRGIQITGNHRDSDRPNPDGYRHDDGQDSEKNSNRARDQAD